MSGLFLLLICLAAVVATGEKSNEESAVFNRLDKNKNGVLDRSEFHSFAESFRQAISPFFPPNGPNFDGIKNKRVIGEAKPQDEEEQQKEAKAGGKNGFWSAFMSSIVSIWATEIGDKTFFIAAILSMQNDRIVVFGGAIGALIIMTILSVAFGGVVGYYIPVEYTHYGGVALFLVFGARMIYDAREMSPDGPSEELAEVEEELQNKKVEKEDSEMEAGASGEGKNDVMLLAENSMQIFTKAFLLTFTAEWGDRSQIATITLGAAKDPLGVTLGGCLGHSMCTGLAVIGGKFLASRISERTVTLIGGILFFIFAFHSFVVGPEKN